MILQLKYILLLKLKNVYFYVKTGSKNVYQKYDVNK